MTTKKTTAPAVPAAEDSTPPATGTPEQQGTPQPAGEEAAGEEPTADTRSEREIELEAENQQLRAELDAEIDDHNLTKAELDEVRGRQALGAGPEDQGEKAPAADAPADADQDAEVNELMRRNGLKKAWQLNSGLCFDERHARHVLGDAAFEAHPVITAD